MQYLPPVFQFLLAVLVFEAGIYDIRERRVPNWLTIAGVLTGVALNTFVYGSSGLWFSLKGIGLALLIYFPLFAIRAMGAGDAKLMAAVGAIAGPVNWFGIFVLTSLIGGVCGIGLMVSTGRAHRTLANMGFLVRQLAYFKAPYLANEELDVNHPKSVGLPHAVMIGLGVFAFLVTAAIWAPRA